VSDKPGKDPERAVSRRGSLLRTFKAVAWSFFGIRKGSEYEKDVAQLNPVHVIVVGIIVAALFVVGLVLLVKWVISSGVAAA
jgi:preprotein translocase subunit Sec61beta